MYTHELSREYIFNNIYYEVNVLVFLTLNKTLKRLNISRYELSKRTDIQYQVIDNYYKNKVKRYDGYVLDRICNALDCDISDIMEYKK